GREQPERGCDRTLARALLSYCGAYAAFVFDYRQPCLGRSFALEGLEQLLGRKRFINNSHVRDFSRPARLDETAYNHYWNIGIDFSERPDRGRAIHYRHGHIDDHRGNFILLLRKYRQRLRSVASSEHLIAPAYQNSADGLS